MHTRLFNPNRCARRGVTLMEVLISIGVLGVGLLGVAAMFPVGSYYMRKGDVADRGAAIAQAAFADLVASGKLDPNNWMMWYENRMPATYFGTANAEPNQKLGRIGVPIREWIQATGSPSVLANQSYNSLFGAAYIIDPLAMSAATTNGELSAVSLAPYNGVAPATGNRNSAQWLTFSKAYPVRRLCTASTVVFDNAGNATWPPRADAARSQFSSNDDLAVSSDTGADRPSRARFEGIDNDGSQDGVVDMPLRRQEQGDYSWIVAIAPTTAEGVTAIATDTSAYYYDVSVVVFYKRAVAAIPDEEKSITANIVATGTGGGELLLNPPGASFNSTIDEDIYKTLKEGQWVMVTGPHPNSTDLRPMLFTQWYRVLAIDDREEPSVTDNQIQISDGDTQRLIGLRGPDWPWNSGDTVSVGLFPGAVAVHTRTMRLAKGSEWQ